MPRTKTSRRLAEVSGRIRKDPGRYKGRRAPASPPLGAASPYLDEHARQAWKLLLQECCWLKESHRSIVEIACLLRGRLMAGQAAGVGVLNLLRLTLAQLGASPADAARIAEPDGEPEDPSDRFYD